MSAGVSDGVLARRSGEILGSYLCSKYLNIVQIFNPITFALNDKFLGDVGLKLFGHCSLCAGRRFGYETKTMGFLHCL